MSAEALDPNEAQDFDLDEDLFNFDEIMGEDSFGGDDEADLNDILAAFDERSEAGEESPREPPAAADQSGSVRVDVSGWEDEDLLPAGRAEPVARPAPARAVGTPREPAPMSVKTGLSKSTVMVLVAVCCVNGLIAMVTLKGTGDMHESVMRVSREVVETAEEIRTEAYQQGAEYHQAVLPIVPPNPENHPTFELAREDIAEGDFALARQRLYSLLSIIDRLDPEERDRVEKRANYLLARALHLEAVTRLEADE